MTVSKANTNTISTSLTGDEQQIALGDLKAGETVSLDVNFTTWNTASGQADGKYLVIQGSSGNSRTVTMPDAKRLSFLSRRTARL